MRSCNSRHCFQKQVTVVSFNNYLSIYISNIYIYIFAHICRYIYRFVHMYKLLMYSRIKFITNEIYYILCNICSQVDSCCFQQINDVPGQCNTYIDTRIIRIHWMDSVCSVRIRLYPSVSVRILYILYSVPYMQCIWHRPCISFI